MSTLRTNALEGVDAKNSITIIAGAGNVTTTNVQEGLLEQWVSYNQTSIVDSFNTTSFTDNGTGDYTHTHTNAMNNALYSVSISSKRATSTNNSGSQHQDGTFTTAAFEMLFVEFDNDPSHDVDMAFTAIHGDLA